MEKLAAALWVKIWDFSQAILLDKFMIQNFTELENSGN
jgi:hypothetical protein